MVSRQLVYVTGMLEVILGPFRPLGAAFPTRLEAKRGLDRLSSLVLKPNEPSRGFLSRGLKPNDPSEGIIPRVGASSEGSESLSHVSGRRPRARKASATRRGVKRDRLWNVFILTSANLHCKCHAFNVKSG